MNTWILIVFLTAGTGIRANVHIHSIELNSKANCEAVRQQLIKTYHSIHTDLPGRVHGFCVEK